MLLIAALFKALLVPSPAPQVAHLITSAAPEPGDRRAEAEIKSPKAPQLVSRGGRLTGATVPPMPVQRNLLKKLNVFCIPYNSLFEVYKASGCWYICEGCAAITTLNFRTSSLLPRKKPLRPVVARFPASSPRQPLGYFP